MIEINNPKNIIAMEISDTLGSEFGEIQILGKDKSASVRVSKTLATSALADLSGLDPIIEEDPIDDQGAQSLADIEDVYFTASHIGFDNSDDEYNTVMLCKKNGRNFLKVNLRSNSREDMVTALTVISSIA
jgi:hypothetical protein